MSQDLERWAPDLAADLERVRRDLPQIPRDEAPHLADQIRRLAPKRSGFLRRSVQPRGPEVLAAEYAGIQSEGGTIKAIRRGWLTIPVRPGYTPGPGYVTVRGRDGNQYVVRSGSYELWAVRRRSVRIPGTRFLPRALAAHLEASVVRLADDFVDEVT